MPVGSGSPQKAMTAPDLPGGGRVAPAPALATGPGGRLVRGLCRGLAGSVERGIGSRRGEVSAAPPRAVEPIPLSVGAQELTPLPRLGAHGSPPGRGGRGGWGGSSGGGGGSSGGGGSVVVVVLDGVVVLVVVAVVVVVVWVPVGGRGVL